MNVRKIYKGFIIVITVLLILIATLAVDTVVDGNKTDGKIEEFKSRAVFVSTIDNCSYYKVSKKYDYEDNTNLYNNYYDENIGTTGDIYICNRDPLGGFFITEWFSRRAWVGHAGIIYNEDASLMLDVIGNKTKEENKVRIIENNWYEKDAEENIVLRVKDIDNQKKQEIINIGNSKLGCKYNYLFVITFKNSFYCTDLVKYIYKQLGYNLNRDLFISTGADMIIEDCTYIIYYKERYVKDNREYYNIYYLEEEKND